MDTDAHPQVPETVFIPASKIRALTRAMLWAAGASVAGVLSFLVYSRLSFQVTGLSNRIVDYCVAVLALPLVGTTLICAWHAVRWLSLVAWPNKTGFWFESGQLRARLGAFGRFAVDRERLSVQYPYDLVDDAHEATFESYLPESQQHDTIVPAMYHPDCPGKIHLRLLAVSGLPEPELAKRIRPMIRHWRGESSSGTDQSGEG